MVRKAHEPKFKNWQMRTKYTKFYGQYTLKFRQFTNLIQKPILESHISNNLQFVVNGQTTRWYFWAQGKLVPTYQLTL